MEQLDPSIVALTKAIGHQESGGSYSKIGDNGHSSGAYQWNNPKPLRSGEIPVNFREFATNVGADPNDFSPTNQDRVAYKTVEKWGKEEKLSPAQIASKWNSGKADAYKTATPGYNAEQGVNYDVGKYVNDVAKYYNTYSNQPPTQKPQSQHFSGLTYEQQSNQPIASNPTISNKAGKTGEVVAALTPGAKLAQGAGYALSNLTGTQKKVTKAQNEAEGIQTSLLGMIREKKSHGEDTSRLESALKDIGGTIQETSSQVGDVGTGGITKGQILKSAASLATLPAAAYGATVIGGGGALGTARGLESGVLGKSQNILEPALRSAIDNSDKLGFSKVLNKGLSLDDTVNLTNFEKFMKLGSSQKADIVRQVIAKNPELARVAKTGVISTFLKQIPWLVGGTVINNILGSKLGQKVTGLLKP